MGDPEYSQNLIFYGWESETGQELDGIALYLLSGRQCAFVLVDANVPNPSDDGIKLAVCTYLGPELIRKLVFYYLRAVWPKHGGPRQLLPQATRSFFSFDEDGELRETDKGAFRFNGQATLTTEVLAFLYRRDIAVILRKALAKKIAMS